MDFMISLFGSEQTGKPRTKRRKPVNDSTRQIGGVCGLSSSVSDAPEDQWTSNYSDFPPEEEEGNVEYKLKLVKPSPSRLEHLVTQLKWRLREGQGEAIYEIGVEDNGMLAGLSESDMEASMDTLNRMAERLGATVTLLRQRDLPTYMCEDGISNSKKVAEVLVRKTDNQEFIDLRVAVLGSVDAGKSTLLGVVTQGEMDNGRGKARLNLFRHLHEVQTGRTSSISLDIVGFNSSGEIVAHDNHSVEEILETSTKLVTFIDLAGHQKYLKTTIFGLTGYRPHFVMLVVAGNTGVVATTREHLGLSMALEVPLYVVVTKIDLATPAMLSRTLDQLRCMLKGPGVNKVPIVIKSKDDAISTVVHFSEEKVVPIFLVSSVTGQNLEYLTEFLNVLPATQCLHERQHQLQELFEFRVDEIFNVQRGETVAAGLLTKGVLREGDQCLAGPALNGEFVLLTIDSIHRNKTPCRIVQAGQAASVAFTNYPVELGLRRGMAIVDPRVRPRACITFEADVFVLYHPSRALCIGFQTTVHIGNVCQTATIEHINKRCLKTNEDGVVRFRFVKSPEYLTEDSRILFRERKTKGIGRITKIFPI